MAKPRKTDATGQPEGIQEDNAAMENTEAEDKIEGDQNEAPAGDGGSEDTQQEPEVGTDENAGNEATEGNDGDEQQPPEGSTPDADDQVPSGESDNTVVRGSYCEDEGKAIEALFSKVMGHSKMPENWSLQNSTKLVRDAWANSKHGRPYPGYETALFELTKDL